MRLRRCWAACRPARPASGAGRKSTWRSCWPSASTGRGTPPSGWTRCSTPRRQGLGLHRRPDPAHVAARGRDPPGSPGRRGPARRRAGVGLRPVERRAGADPGSEPLGQPVSALDRATARGPAAGGPSGVQRVHGRSVGDGGAHRPPLRGRPRPRRGGGAAGLRPGHGARGRAAARRPTPCASVRSPCGGARWCAPSSTSWRRSSRWRATP